MHASVTTFEKNQLGSRFR